MRVTLRGDGWSGNTQSVSVPGLTDSTTGVVSVDQSATEEQLNLAAQAKIHVVNQYADSLTIATNGKTPNIDIPLAVILLNQEG